MAGPTVFKCHPVPHKLCTETALLHNRLKQTETEGLFPTTLMLPSHAESSK
jgi:hypothetical protein